MTTFTAEVQAEHRVHIPKVVRKAEGIKEGDLVSVTVEKVKPHIVANAIYPDGCST